VEDFNNHTNMAGGMAQVVKHLLSMYEAQYHQKRIKILSFQPYEQFEPKMVLLYSLPACLKRKQKPSTGGSPYNPSYAGGREQEHRGSKPAQAYSLGDPILKSPSQK
jgi:hypothetical protein